MTSVLNEPYFHDEAAAFRALDAIVWPEGPVCPHCGAKDRLGRLEGVRSKPSKKNPDGVVRHGLWKCYRCKKQFTARKGTVFESSHLELRQWLQAAFLMCSSKKGVSSNQLARTLKITVKSAWFASHRLREAMRDGGLVIMGGGGKTVEADETYFGTIPKAEIMPEAPGKGGRLAGIRRPAHRAVLALVERGGKARTFHIAQANQDTVSGIMRENVARESRIHTDESQIYNIVPWQFAKHETVKHSDYEYVRGDVTTNSVEGYFSIFKRGMKGIYQHCSEKHLHRYLAEFDFRYNHRVRLGLNDAARTEKALRDIVRKRLKYKDS